MTRWSSRSHQFRHGLRFEPTSPWIEGSQSASYLTIGIWQVCLTVKPMVSTLKRFTRWMRRSLLPIVPETLGKKPFSQREVYWVVHYTTYRTCCFMYHPRRNHPWSSVLLNDTNLITGAQIHTLKTPGPNFMALLTAKFCACDHHPPLTVQAPNFCASCVSEECLVAWSTAVH